jgi:phosphate transport system permease protein
VKVQPVSRTAEELVVAAETKQKRRHRRVPLWHRLAEIAIHVMALSAVLAIVLIFVFVGRETLPLFTSEAIRAEVDQARMWLSQLWPGYDAPEHVWQPVSDVPKYGLWPLIIGTLKVTTIAMVIATPLGIGAAIYVSQFARPKVRETVKPIIELLAAIPSVVLGFFALIVLATWLQDTFGLESRLSALLAGVALAIALVPVIFTMSEDALRSVPRSYVEASTALGAARWQTILRVVIPAASPGLLAATALGFGRAIGETMIVLMASGNAAILSGSFTDSTRTLSATIAAELAEVVFGEAHYTVLFFIGSLLFLITFVINLIGGIAVERMKARLGGPA